jgi:hypothetical protein
VFVHAPASHGRGVAQVCNTEDPRTAELEDCLAHELPMQKTLPKGHASCLPPTFKYTPSVHTDLAKTFARIRRPYNPTLDSEQGNVRLLRQSPA